MRPLSEITIPTFLIGGLQDGYRDNVPDMLMKSKAPIKAIVGPWNHSFPNDADFGPRVEWRDQAVRWFDYWLKGRDTGVRERSAARDLHAALASAGSKSAECAGRMAAGRCVAAARREEHDAIPVKRITRLERIAGSSRYTSAEVCSHSRRGGRLLVGRVVERSAAGGCIQPGLRFGAAGT